jgi:SAM-dependent methyltransferase
LCARDDAFSTHEGTREHYEDAALYDHEYRRRRVDVNFYRALASEIGAAPLLELGCGSGRLLVPLCRDGRRVTGVDRSSAMLAAAAGRLQRIGRRAQHAQLLRADFRDLPIGRAHFALVLCPFNTLQHLYTREDFERFLGSTRRALLPGGRLAFDVMNPDLEWLARRPDKRWARTRFHHPQTGEVLHYSTNHVYDRATQINYIRIYYESEGGGPERVVRLTHRMFFPAEIEALLHYNGWRLLARYGDFGWGPLEQASEEQVCIAEPI